MHDLWCFQARLWLRRDYIVSIKKAIIRKKWNAPHVLLYVIKMNASKSWSLYHFWLKQLEITIKLEFVFADKKTWKMHKNNNDIVCIIHDEHKNFLFLLMYLFSWGIGAKLCGCGINRFAIYIRSFIQLNDFSLKIVDDPESTSRSNKIKINDVKLEIRKSSKFRSANFIFS